MAVERCLLLVLTLCLLLLLLVLALRIDLSFGIVLCVREYLDNALVRAEGSLLLIGSDGLVQVLGPIRSHAYLKVCKREVSTYAYCPGKSLDYGNYKTHGYFPFVGQET